MKQFIYLTIAVAMIVTANACSKTTSDKKTETSITHAHLAVNGSCEMCKERIESAAKAVEGVASVAWDGEEQQLHLNFDAAATSLETIAEAIAQAGHDTALDKAPDDVYNALPECCKYRE
ncbi:MAG: cation transporter [Dysgonamonadaceae bacterium]|jgi:Cu(I)/Ag(I) efflux system membrane fusion protein|nr:cation transporter [Dysgonamonadaceae bacterium]